MNSKEYTEIDDEKDGNFPSKRYLSTVPKDQNSAQNRIKCGTSDPLLCQSPSSHYSFSIYIATAQYYNRQAPRLNNPNEKYDGKETLNGDDNNSNEKKQG